MIYVLRQKKTSLLTCLIFDGIVHTYMEQVKSLITFHKHYIGTGQAGERFISGWWFGYSFITDFNKITFCIRHTSVHPVVTIFQWSGCSADNGCHAPTGRLIAYRECYIVAVEIENIQFLSNATTCYGLPEQRQSNNQSASVHIWVGVVEMIFARTECTLSTIWAIKIRREL